MKLIEALSIVKSGESRTGPSFRVLLATGFTQLPLEILFKAHLYLGAPEKRISVEGGLFGDLAGNLERAGTVDAVAAAMEWEDLDPRLGARTLGGWTVAALPDILRSARLQLERIAAALRSVSAPVALSLPSLPFPPVAYSSPRQLSRLEAELRASLQQFAAEAGTNVRVLNPYELDRMSPWDARFDPQAAIASGFPYVLDHAGALASLLAGLLLRQAPKKGLITDLDDTLWAGILGEIGIRGVCWDLDGKAQVHGLYQQFLASLASAGVLIGVASKNDPKLVDQLFAERQDLLLPAPSVFPVKAHWGPKSESVANILQDWNIAARDVVFLDDSPMEVAEVQSVFPEMECLVFPKKSPPEFWGLLYRLRETFAKSSVSAEDELRLRSLRAASVFRQEAGGGSVSERFLGGVEAEISVSRDKRPDARAFELINKTNQFNLNGLRIAESEWNALLSEPESFLLKLAYRDRFGPLGSIAVVAGRQHGRQLRVEHWVMSCRAFSRRIEYQALQLLFECFAVDEVLLSYVSTQFNGPLREFLEKLLGPIATGTLRIRRGQFNEACPALYHSVKDAPTPTQLPTQSPQVG
jgi:FkbH-like protein